MVLLLQKLQISALSGEISFSVSSTCTLLVVPKRLNLAIVQQYPNHQSSYKLNDCDREKLTFLQLVVQLLSKVLS